MKDFTLCAPDQSTLEAALAAAGMIMTDPDTGQSAPMAAGPGWALDVIGNYPGGYWANLRYDSDSAMLPESLSQYTAVRPSPPYRVWA